MTSPIPPGVDPDSIGHVEPVGDLREHVTDERGQCWCKPAVELVDGGRGWIVIHNALDGREDYETGRRRPT